MSDRSSGSSVKPSGCALVPSQVLDIKQVCYLTRKFDYGACIQPLSISERCEIERWGHAKVPVDEMARVLRCCKSTIFPELKCNHSSGPGMPNCAGCYSAAAQLLAADRRTRQRDKRTHSAATRNFTNLTRRAGYTCATRPAGPTRGVVSTISVPPPNQGSRGRRPTGSVRSMTSSERLQGSLLSSAGRWTCRGIVPPL
jgi:helix-turn-helix protein